LLGDVRSSIQSNSLRSLLIGLGVGTLLRTLFPCGSTPPAHRHPRSQAPLNLRSRHCLCLPQACRPTLMRRRRRPPTLSVSSAVEITVTTSLMTSDPRRNKHVDRCVGRGHDAGTVDAPGRRPGDWQHKSTDFGDILMRRSAPAIRPLTPGRRDLRN